MTYLYLQMNDYINHLLSYVPPERISTLSCDHVIPLGNLVAWPVAKGASGQEFEFTFSKRNLEAMVGMSWSNWTHC